MPSYSPDASQIIATAFNTEVIVPGKLDVQNTPLYDTCVLVQGPGVPSIVNNQNVNFFTNVGPASGKTRAQTNMELSRELPFPKAFSIFGARLWFREDILLLDLLNVLDGFCLQLYLGDKCYLEAPLRHFSAGAGISGMTTRTFSSIYTNGIPGREHMHKLAIPIVIPNGMTFYAQFQGNPYVLTTVALGGTGMTVCLELDGFYARGVQ
jgi:hypothetical protein